MKVMKKEKKREEIKKGKRGGEEGRNIERKGRKEGK
jgi:hypothetical protein